MGEFQISAEHGRGPGEWGPVRSIAVILSLIILYVAFDSLAKSVRGE